MINSHKDYSRDIGLIKKIVTATFIMVLGALIAAGGYWLLKPTEAEAQFSHFIRFWTATSSPFTAVTPIADRNLYMPFSTGTSSRWYSDTYCINNTTPDCITEWPSGGSGTEPTWELTNNIFSQSALRPTTTQNVLVNGVGTSTFSGGLEAWRQIAAPYFHATSTTDSTFEAGIDIGGDLTFLNANSNIVDAGNISFQTGATGGTIRTGTANADKWSLQARDVDGGSYVTVAQADAGNDPTFTLFDESLLFTDTDDTSKLVAFELGGLTTATTRTLTVPDASGTFALTSDLHDAVTLSGALDYITLSGQQITRNAIDLTADVSGVLADGNFDKTGNWTGTLDSLEGSQFLRSDVADSASGLLTLNGGFISNASSTHTAKLNFQNATGTQLTIDNNLYLDQITGTSGVAGDLTISGRPLVQASLLNGNGLFDLYSNTGAAKWRFQATESGGAFIFRDVVSSTNPFIINQGVPTQSVQLSASEAVINDAGNDYDFRVEGDTEPNLLFVNAGTDRVGIGTDSPGRALHIDVSSADGLRLSRSGTTGFDDIDLRAVQYGAGENNRGFEVLNRTDNSSIALFSQGGNVGIGTQAPTSALHVDGGSSPVLIEGTPNPIVSIVGGSGESALIRFGNTEDTDSAQFAYGPSVINSKPTFTLGTRIANGQILFRTANNSNVGLWNEDGELGIGTTDPQALLDVNGTTTTQALNLGSWTTKAQITADQNDYALGEGTLFRIPNDGSSHTITGIVAGSDGDMIIVQNAGSVQMVFAHDNASSAAANRLFLGSGSSSTIGDGGSITFVYDATRSRWIATTVEP